MTLLPAPPTPRHSRRELMGAPRPSKEAALSLGRALSFLFSRRPFPLSKMGNRQRAIRDFSAYMGPAGPLWHRRTRAGVHPDRVVYVLPVSAIRHDSGRPTRGWLCPTVPAGPGRKRAVVAGSSCAGCVISAVLSSPAARRQAVLLGNRTRCRVNDVW